MADEELRDSIAAFLRTHIRPHPDAKYSQESQEAFEKEVDRRVNGQLGQSIRLFHDERGRYPDIGEIQELVNQQGLVRQQEMMRQREQFAASSQSIADKELRALVREVLTKCFLCGEDFERRVKEEAEGGGRTREELIEHFIDLLLPEMGPALKAFRAEHGQYPNFAEMHLWRTYCRQT
jgi:hypothetical protein